jgi:hypothetical protein
MVAVPGINTNGMGVDNWWAFRDQSADVFKYFEGYQIIDVTAPGTGYWMKHSGARTYNTGEEWPAAGIQIVNSEPIPIKAGWNLISVYGCSVPAGQITTNPSGLQSGPIYGYTAGYVISTTLYPGSAYWFKSTSDGWLIVPPCN